MLDRGMLLHGRYEILSLVGRGGMSYVYLARDVQLNKNWAVKQVRKQGSVDMQYAVNSLMAEAGIMKRLDHPALPRIVDIFDDSDDLFVVMDYVEGRPLGDLIPAGGIPYSTAVSWTVQLCDVLTYLHSQDPPIVYRDMKPPNIMVAPEGSRVKLLDFGIAREFSDEKAEDTVALGTRGYAAPEQVGTGARTDPRTDIYGLGMTLYHMLTGVSPNSGGFVARPLRKVNPAIPEGLERIVARATRPDAGDRYQSAEDMKEDLMRYEKLTYEYITEQKKHLRKVLVPLVLGAVLIAAGALMLIVDSSRTEDTYSSLLAQTGSPETRIENITQAIEMKPSDPRGYEALLDEYAQSGFTETESSRLLEIFNSNRESMDRSSEEYLDLCFEIGENFLMYYEGKSDSSTRNRILKAEPFFSEISEDEANSGYRNFAVAGTYTELASFYREYMIGSGSLIVKEASAEEYEKLIDAVGTLADGLEGLDGDNAAYLRVVSCSIACGILDGRISGIVSAGIEKTRAEGVCSRLMEVCSASECTGDGENGKKKQVLRNIESLADKIDSSYRYERKVKDS